MKGFKIIYLIILMLGLNSSAIAQFTFKAPGGYTNYQWFKVDASGVMLVVGATTDSLNISSPGIYYATYEGTIYGKNASEYFVLTANADSNLVLKANQNNATYQWYKNNSQLVGSTAASLSVVSINTLHYYRAESFSPACNKQLPGFYVYHLGPWSPLPIQLLLFQARLSSDKKNVLLDWKTKSEINTNYFTVERSVDQLHWEYVAQQAAAGSSMHELKYNVIDYTPHKGQSYYRLKTTDIDNSSTYSQIEPIFIGEVSIDYVRIYPNPFSDKIIIEGPEDEFEELKIYNAFGQMVRNIPVTHLFIAPNKKEIDVSDLASGVYFVRTRNFHIKILKRD